MSTSLTVAQLFQPAPSGVGPYGNVPTLPPQGSWLAIMLQIASTVQLPTTSWQPGAPERTILAIEAVSFAQSDADISQIAQGAFLDSAATGTVTYTAVDGTTITIAVTPDPANPAQNPTGALGWLDLLTTSTFDVIRLVATQATGPLAFANVGASTPTYAAGAYHAGNAATGATYTNVSALAIPPSVVAGVTITSVAPGVAFTILGTNIPHGLAVGQVVYLTIPQSAGVTGLYQRFAVVTAITSTTFQAPLNSSGSYVPGAYPLYLCTLATMIADAAGTASNAGPGQVTTPITQNANVSIFNALAWSGSNWESNVALAARARLALAAASPNGPAQAYEYFAETSGQLLAAQVPPYILTNGSVVASVYAPVATGIATIVVASSTPASVVLGANVTPGYAQNPIAGVTNANPCVITCAAPTGQLAGQPMAVIVSGVQGTLGVNASFVATYVSPTSFSIPIDTTAAGAYTFGGSVEGGDLGEIDALIQANCVPDGDVAITVSALALPISIVATVAVPNAMVAIYTLAVVTQLQAQIASYAVGGNAPLFSVAYDDIVGALEEAGVLTLGAASYVRGVISLSINGGAVGVGVAIPTNYQAILVAPSISVVGV